MPYTISSFRALVPLTALALLGGCATLPARQKIAPPKAVSLNLNAALPAGTNGTFPADKWWLAYQDPALEAVIAEALQNAPDMNVAAARARAAEALAAQAGDAFLPSLSVEGAAGGTKQSYNMGIPKQFVPKGVTSMGRVTAGLGFNLDLWGKNRAALAAARGEATAARVDAAQAQLLLTTSIASAWIDLAQIEAAREIARETSRLRAQTLQLTQDRQHAGIDNASDVALAKSRAEAAQAELVAMEELATLTRHRIAALMGTTPDRGESLPRPALTSLPVRALPDQLGATLLGRRPDLVSARLRTEAAASRVKVAHRSFYPNINLTAVAGVQSLGLNNLFTKDSTTANFGPAISLPIFAGGQLRAQYRGAQAGYAEAVARYDQTLLNALRETADAIASRRAVDDRLSHIRSSQAAAEESAKFARERYRQGIGNLLQVNAAEDAALSAQRSLSEVQARALALDVALVRALGGGFRDPKEQ